ncbi:c-type cytochrome [Pleionea sediminis]|uniref:c-type cytochrome n=1 Tax=Pleionea sediminis TaxID=2569479 RepID=UPI0011852194|nr:c-type cytochrome [Pleionea sediminis]
MQPKLLCLFFVLMILTVPTLAKKWSWPEKPENLKVLPNEWSGERLKPIMIGFTRSLGVRCSHCHVGEDGKSLATYDFASDENPNKERAREMLRMLNSINGHLNKIQPSGEKVNVWCHTCHQGKARPMTLAEALREKFQEKNAAETLDYYQQLKDKYFGRGAYDFGSTRVFNEVGYSALKEGDVNSALVFFKKNTELFPTFFNVWDSYAEALLKSGNRDKSLFYYKKSLELNPKNKNAKRMIEKISSENDD